jgi:signal transduction histidine kinase
MRKVALVFVLAVFVPSLVLAWLAVRSLRDQQFILERQQSLLYQGVADAKAKDVQDALAEYQHSFAAQVAKLLGKRDPLEIAGTFDDSLRREWPMAQVGFCVSLAGEIKAPAPYGRAEARKFLDDNGRFLANRESVDVYTNPKQLLANANTANYQNAQPQPSSSLQNDLPNDITRQAAFNKFQQRSVFPQQQTLSSQRQDPTEQAQQQISKAAAAPAEFRQLIGEENEGTLARFVDNKLNVLCWYRSPSDPQFVFGTQLALPRLIAGLSPLVQQVETALRGEICVALLDDTAKPVALSHPGFHTTWKRPFVATEIGEALPHWELAVYLLNPAKLTQSAHALKLTLGLLIAVLLSAIGVGSWLIVADLNRQLTLARQKTDFVSNVSHELKTPLTSIRMFSELLAEGRVTDQSKQRTYLGIITAETARLTRLINNVLDFARIERGEKKYNFQRCDLVSVVRETAETYRPHLEANGFQFACGLPDTPVFVNGDRDALSQVVVNLLSNAEKYSDSRKEIALCLSPVEPHATAFATSPERAGTRCSPSLPDSAWQGSPERCRRSPLSPSEGEGAGVRGPASPPESLEQATSPARNYRSHVAVQVLDRGLGVPKGCEEKIFEQFYRAHDSLSNGIQGSGLGLTLARQIARAHGGEVVFEPRAGGGSCFTLKLPVMALAKREDRSSKSETRGASG